MRKKQDGVAGEQIRPNMVYIKIVTQKRPSIMSHRTMTVSELKAKAASLDVKESGVIVTQNGIPKYVVESYEEYERREEAIALLRIVAMARSDEKQGRVLSSDDLKRHLDNLRPDNLDD